jgi:hypothetical protein
MPGEFPDFELPDIETPKGVVEVDPLRFRRIGAGPVGFQSMTPLPLPGDGLAPPNLDDCEQCP